MPIDVIVATAVQSSKIEVRESFMPRLCQRRGTLATVRNSIAI